MSVFSGPVEHAANPPETWKVSKQANRSWYVTTSDGAKVLHRARSKGEAVAAIRVGFIRNLYDRETRWYAGESIPGWRDYKDA